MLKAYGKLLSFLNTSYMAFNPFPADVSSQSCHPHGPLSVGLSARINSAMGKISSSPAENQSVHRLRAVLASVITH